MKTVPENRRFQLIMKMLLQADIANDRSGNDQ